MDMDNNDNISFCDVIKITQIATNIIKIMSIDSDILKHYLNTEVFIILCVLEKKLLRNFLLFVEF